MTLSPVITKECPLTASGSLDLLLAHCWNCSTLMVALLVATPEDAFLSFGRVLSTAWLLLRDAVYRTEAINQRLAVYPYDLLRWERFAYRCQGSAIVNVIEGGYQHDRVSHVEVGIARGKPFVPS